MCKPEDLMGAGDIAEYLGMTKQNLSMLISRNQFIPHFARLSCGKIWLKADVEVLHADITANRIERAEAKEAKAKLLLEEAADLRKRATEL